MRSKIHWLWLVVCLVTARLPAQPAGKPSVRIVEPEDGILVKPETNLVIRADVQGGKGAISVDF